MRNAGTIPGVVLSAWGGPGLDWAAMVLARNRTTYTETAPNVVGGRGTPGTMGACGVTSWLWNWSEKPGSRCRGPVTQREGCRRGGSVA